MSAKKTCVACGKQIPDVAVVCVFCSAKQPSRRRRDCAEAGDAAGRRSRRWSAESASPSHRSDAARDQASDVQAALAEDGRARRRADRRDAADGTANGAVGDAPDGGDGGARRRPAGDDGAGAGRGELRRRAAGRGIARAERRPSTGAARRAARRSRSSRGAASAASSWASAAPCSIALFFCPWHGVSSWQLLETLAGADFVRQLFYLTGGIVLRRLRALAAAVRLPRRRRHLRRGDAGRCSAPAASSTAGAAWSRRWPSSACRRRTCCARARSARRRRACWCSRRWRRWRCSICCRVVGGADRFVVQDDGVGLARRRHLRPSSCSCRSSSPRCRCSACSGRDLTDIGVLLSVLILLWAPVGVALRGIMIEDATQLYVARRRSCGLRRRRRCRWRSCCRWPRRARHGA